MTVTEEVRPRGRPRGHSGAKEREDAILKALDGKRVRYAGLRELWEAGGSVHGAEPSPGLTRNELASALGEPESKVYLALDRLRKEGRVRKCSGEGSTTVWTTGAGCP
jgi:hypothetical protein